MRSRLVIGAVLLATASAGCSYFPGGIPTTGSRSEVRSSGCADATPRTPGQETISTTSGGVARTYIRRIPQGYDATTPIPVVFDFHGYAEGSAIHVTMSEMAPLADANRFVVIYPQGLGSTPAWNPSIGSPDLAYFGNLLNEVERNLCLDQRRVFVQGLSMGAFMTSSIACQYADRVAAVGMVAGMLNPTGCAPSRPVPAVTFHGTADTWVPFGPIPANVAAWAARNGCQGTPNEVTIASDVTLVRYLCALGHEVGFYRIAGGGHAWPGSAASRAIAAAVGFTTFSISASPIMWDFFAHHPLPQAHT